MIPALALILQAPVQPGWVGPTMALSLAVIALAILACAIVIVVAARSAAASTRAIRDELRPALESARRIAADGEALSGRMRGEAEQVIHTARRLRRRVDSAADEAEARLAELGALYDVVYEEVEDTALSLAGSLRAGRTVAGAARSLLGGRRRRKKRKLRRWSA